MILRVQSTPVNNYALLYISWGAQKSITFLVAVCTNLELHMFNNNRAIPISIEFFNTE